MGVLNWSVICQVTVIWSVNEIANKGTYLVKNRQKRANVIYERPL
jgi:hypothetical protein